MARRDFLKEAEFEKAFFFLFLFLIEVQLTYNISFPVYKIVIQRLYT